MAHIQIPDVAPKNEYTADGVETIFDYVFPIFEDEDLAVYADGVFQVSGYTVTGAGETAGGTVEFSIAPADGTIITLLRSRAAQRTADFQDSGPLRASTVNDELDILTLGLQDVSYAQSYAIMASQFDGDPGDFTLPAIATRANKYLGFDSGGAVITLTDAPTSELLSEKITLVDTLFDYTLPVSIQSTADEDNYAVTLVNGGELIRGAAYDFTVASNVLTLNTTPTVANGLAGEEILVELIRPGIDGASVQPRSIGSSEIALLGVESENLLFTGQANGDILFRSGGEWLPVAAPGSDGRYKLNMVVGGAGTTQALSWVKGGLINTYQYAAFNNSVVSITSTVVDDNNKMQITEGQEILTWTFTLSANVTNVRIEVIAYASCDNDQVLRMGLFRAGTTDALKEARAGQPTHSGHEFMRPMHIDHVYSTTSPGSVTYSVRIGKTTGAAYLNADTDGVPVGGGNIGCSMFITELGSSSS